MQIGFVTPGVCVCIIGLSRKHFTFLRYGFILRSSMNIFVIGGADIDAKDNRGQTALMISARRGHLVVAKCLLSHKASPIICDYEALEPIDYCRRGDYRMKKLINKFAGESAWFFVID